MSTSSEVDEEDFASASEGETSPTETKKPETKPASLDQASSAWSGWSTFFNSAVTAVQESFKEDIDTLYVSAKNLTENVQKSLMSPTEDEKSEQPKNESEKKSSRSSNPDKVPTEAIMKSTETVLAAIDKTLDFTSDLLGNAVLGAYGQIKEVNDSEILTHGKQVGSNIVANGLTALEAIGTVVGAKAAKALADARGNKKEKTEKNETEKEIVKSQPKEVTLEQLFEDNCGNAHLQALEMLAFESNAQIDGYSKETVQKHENDIEKIKIILSDFSKYPKITESKFLSEEGFEEIKNTLQDLSVPSVQLKQIQEFLKESYSELERLKKSEEGRNVQVRKLRNSYLRILADFCEKGCEQTLRVAEIILMYIAEEGLKTDGTNEINMTEKGLNFAEGCNELTLLLLSELYCLQHNFVLFVKELCEESEGEEKDLINQELTKMDNDLSKSLGLIQSATEYITPIINLMVLKPTQGKK